DRLIGAFVATLGLPQVNPVNEQMKQRMQALFGRGYDYTYLFPGLQKVLQAAGRVIRTPSDRGTLHLLDDRFAQPQVRRLLPGWWSVDSTRIPLTQYEKCLPVTGNWRNDGEWRIMRDPFQRAHTMNHHSPDDRPRAPSPTPPAGCLVYLIGPSGAGKDSLLRAAAEPLAALGARIATRVITRPAGSI